MDQIKAIETEYAGHKFRSRLEARWAVFFDALGIHWHYEEEGLDLPSGRYLPDFRLERVARHGRQDVWCEVKGRLDAKGLNRLFRVALDLPQHRLSLQWPQILVLGEVPSPDPGAAWTHVRLDTSPDVVHLQMVFFGLDSHLGPERYVTRPLRDPVSFERPWEQTWTDEQVSDLCDWLVKPAEDFDVRLHPAVTEAYRAARSARFEFGQSGATF